MNKFYIILFTIFIASTATSYAGDTARVLFIGNSYTYVNDLPGTLSNMAAASGDVLIKQQNTPGGWTFQQHSTDATTLSLIMQGGWDYVVLQEQSQRPSFSDAQVATDVYPYAKKLDSLVHHYNTCAKTIFYMTWGYKNGDQSNCPFLPTSCTYNGMDSMLKRHYSAMADSNNALLCPAGWVWHKIRDQYPAINLYDVDESHPSPQGTFATACSFYSLIFHKNPASNSYNFTLNATEAGNIKQIAKLHVYDSISYWSHFANLPQASFTRTVNGHVVNFTSTAQNANTWLWLFGDGDQSTAQNPSHTYAALGNYTVKHIAISCALKDTTSQQINIIGAAGIATTGNSEEITIYPNPATETINIQAPFTIKTVQLSDLTGRKIVTYSDANGINNITGLDKLEAGIYILCINGQYYRQVIKK